MNDGVIFQYYEGALHGDMVAAAYNRHVTYAKRHGFDYIVTEEPGPVDAAFGWIRWSRMLEYLERYEHVIHIEDDAVIDDMSVDLRDATEARPLAMYYGGKPEHYQSGVIFARRDLRVRRFILEVMAECPEPGLSEETQTDWWKRQYCQQWTVTLLLQLVRYREIVTRLPLKWNNALWHNAHEYLGLDAKLPPIIRAWHGIPGERRKLAEIRRFVESVGSS